MEFSLKQAQALVDTFGGDEETRMTVEDGDGKGHSGDGLYAWPSEYPDEGSVFLGEE